MVKTTVYLDDSDAVALRRISAQTGRPQAEIVREALSQALAPARKRVFKSFGAGHSGGKEAISQNDEEILAREWTPENLS